MRDYYKILGLSYKATAREIKSAYRKLAKKYHPDVSQDPEAREKFLLIREAYETLGDPQKKKIYDVKLHQTKLLKELNKVRRKIILEQQKQTYEKIRQRQEKENKLADFFAWRWVIITFVFFGISGFVLMRYLSAYLPVNPEPELDLSYRHLSVFPRSLVGSEKVFVLRLDHNSFEKIPVEVTTLPHLHSLDLSHNQIMEVSEEILKFPEGLYLNLSNNFISEISWEILKQRNKIGKITINLKNNPLSEEFKKECLREKTKKVILIF